MTQPKLCGSNRSSFQMSLESLADKCSMLGTRRPPAVKLGQMCTCLTTTLTVVKLDWVPARTENRMLKENGLKRAIISTQTELVNVAKMRKDLECLLSLPNSVLV